MIPLDPLRAAHEAVSAGRDRPATAVLHDAPDLRLVVFRLSAGQAVPPHRSVATVQLTVLAGHGTLSGEQDGRPAERSCRPGDVVVYAPGELHGMQAGDDTLCLLAAIAPRPGSR